MSLFKHVVEIGLAFLDGYAKGCAIERDHQQRFADYMEFLSRETGLPIVSIDQASATFSATAGASSYPVVIGLKGDEVVMHVVSLIAFPRDRAPSVICELLRDKNREMAPCEYGLFEGNDGDRFYVKGLIEAEKLTPYQFEVGVEEMVPRMVALDRLLREQGYVR